MAKFEKIPQPYDMARHFTKYPDGFTPMEQLTNLVSTLNDIIEFLEAGGSTEGGGSTGGSTGLDIAQLEAYFKKKEYNASNGADEYPSFKVLSGMLKEHMPEVLSEFRTDEHIKNVVYELISLRMQNGQDSYHTGIVTRDVLEDVIHGVNFQVTTDFNDYGDGSGIIIIKATRNLDKFASITNPLGDSEAHNMDIYDSSMFITNENGEYDIDVPLRWEVEDYLGQKQNIEFFVRYQGEVAGWSVSSPQVIK